MCNVIENIFVYSALFSYPSASPIINGLSDHDDHYLMINNVATAHNFGAMLQLKKNVQAKRMADIKLI